MGFFEEENHIYNMATIGIDFKLKRMDLDNNRLKIQLWDPSVSMRFISAS